MDSEVKKLWIEALRSDKYQQASGRLREGDGYCCLGVLCDIHRKIMGGEWEKTYKSKSWFLPIDVVAWAGLDDMSPTANGATLANLNDGGKTFEQIADVIERYL